MTGHQAGEVRRELEAVFRDGPVSGLSDAELLRRFQARDAGSDAAFEALVRRHGPMVWRLCRRIVGHPSDAADAFQATFLVLVRKGGSVRVADSLAPWLYGVGVRVARRARAASSRRQARERTDGTLPEAAASADAPDPDLAAVLDEELARLPARYRSALALCYLEGLTHEETAHRLSWPVGTVRSRLARGRDLLRSRLARRGFAPGLLGASAVLAPAAAPAAVPPALIGSTTRLAMAAAAAPATVAALVAGTLRSMLVARWTRVAVLLALVPLAAIGAAWSLRAAGPRNDAPLPAITVEQLSLKIEDAAKGFEVGLIEVEFDEERLDLSTELKLQRPIPFAPGAPVPPVDVDPEDVAPVKPVYHRAPGRFRYGSDGRRWKAEYDSRNLSLGNPLADGQLPPDRWTSGYDGMLHYRYESDAVYLGESQAEVKDLTPRSLFWDGAASSLILGLVMRPGSKVTQRTVGGYRCYVVEAIYPESPGERLEAVISPRQSFLPLQLTAYYEGQVERSFRIAHAVRLADGRWYPGRLVVEQRFPSKHPGPMLLSSRRDIRVTRFEPDHRFQPADFVLTIPDNVKVLDRRTQLFYRNDPWWPEIGQYLATKFDWPCADLASLDQLNSPAPLLDGREVPALVVDRWLKGPPIDRKAVRGKVVLLVFPNPGDATLVPALRRLAKVYEPAGLVVAEVVPHTTARDEQDEMQFVAEFAVDHARALDGPLAGRHGATCAAFGVRTDADLPAAYLIDHEGNVRTIGAGKCLEAVVDQLRQAGAKNVEPLAPADSPGFGLRSMRLFRAWNEWTTSAPATAKLAGTIVDSGGKPVAGAKVRAHLFASVLGDWNSNLRFDSPRAFETRSSASGDFEIAGLCKGNYTVEVTAPGVAQATQEVVIGPTLEAIRVTLALKDGDTIAGTVRDQSGRPVAGALAELFGRHYKGSNDTVIYPLELKRTAQTGPDGRFRIERVLEGRFSLKISADGLESQTREEVPAGSTGLDFTLSGSN